MKAALLALATLFQASGVVPFGRSCERGMRDAPTAWVMAKPSAAAVARSVAIGAILGSGAS